MVAACSFLIDATFLLEDAEKAFLGVAGIVDSHGRNNSVVYGAVRDMLRLRRTLGIVNGVIVVGAEATKVSTPTNIENLRDCLRSLGTYVVHEPNACVGTLCRSILKERKKRWIVTRDKALMQLADPSCGIIVTAEGTPPEVVTAEKLVTDFGIRPDQVPSFLALTEGGLGAALSRKQAARLLEVHGTLDGIFEKTAVIAASPKTQRHLLENKVALLGRLADLTIRDGDSTDAPPICEVVRDDDRSKRSLKLYGFPSLGRLLTHPGRVDLVTEVNDRGLTYVAVVDRAGLASAVLDHELRQLIPNENRTLDILQSLTGDRSLKRDRKARKGEFIIGDDPVLAGLDHADALISIAIGLPNAALCRRFLIDPRRAAVLRELVVGRYARLFEWLDIEVLKKLKIPDFFTDSLRVVLEMLVPLGKVFRDCPLHMCRVRIIGVINDRSRHSTEHTFDHIEKLRGYRKRHQFDYRAGGERSGLVVEMIQRFEEQRGIVPCYRIPGDI